MSLFSLMRMFTIRFRMLGAIAVVLCLLGMLGMLRIQAMSEEFMAHEFKEVGNMGDLRAALGAIRQHEKDMIIQYEKPEAVKQAHTQWLASLEAAKKVANRFLEGADDEDNAVVRQLVQRLDSYRDQFAHVARQLESGGYDSATIANRMSGKAVAEFAAADKLAQDLDALLHAEVKASAQAQEKAGTQTKWLFALAVLVTVLVVAPLTGGHLQTAGRGPAHGAGNRWRRFVAKNPYQRARRGRRPAARAGRNAARPGRAGGAGARCQRQHRHGQPGDRQRQPGPVAAH
jgi:hypothetical protein